MPSEAPVTVPCSKPHLWSVASDHLGSILPPPPPKRVSLGSPFTNITQSSMYFLGLTHWCRERAACSPTPPGTPVGGCADTSEHGDSRTGPHCCLDTLTPPPPRPPAGLSLRQLGVSTLPSSTPHAHCRHAEFLQLVSPLSHEGAWRRVPGRPLSAPSCSEPRWNPTAVRVLVSPPSPRFKRRRPFPRRVHGV